MTSQNQIMIQVTEYVEQAGEIGDDSLLICESPESVVFCIADGAGGTGNGLEASQYVANALKESPNLMSLDSTESFEAFLRKIDLEIFAASNCGETTVVIGKISGGCVTGASVGDSEAWLFSNEFDYELTSLQITKPLLGSGTATPIGFGPMDTSTLVIGSDGLFKYANFKKIREVAFNYESTAENLANLAKLETGKLQDDISVIKLQVKS